MIFVGALVLSVCVGILTGLFGVGGGFLITPLLHVILGIPIHIAVGTGAMQILGVSTAGLYAKRKEGRVDYKMAVMLFGGNYVGVRLGAATLSWLQGLGQLTLGRQQIATVDLAVLLIFIVLLGGITFWLWYDTSRNTQEQETCVGLLSRITWGPCTEFPTLDHPRLSIVIMSYLGLALGFLTGLLGIGGGVILVPALIYLVGMRAHTASATSLAMVWCTSFLATITHAAAGNTDIRLAIPLLLGGSIGLQIGVNLCNRLGGRQLKRYFSFVVLAATLLVASKLVSVLF